MDHLRSRHRVALTGVLLVLVGCASSSPLPSVTATGAATSPSPSAQPSDTSLRAPSTPGPPPTSLPGPTPAAPEPASALDAEGPGPLGSEVLLPDDPTGAPVAVLVHGGAWIAGTPASMAPLARALTDRGLVTVNLSYATLALGGREPRLTDDVACGLRQARAVADEVGATGPLLLVGHSAGAHLATVVALSPGDRAPDCPWRGDATPDRLVTLAGVFAIDAVEVVMRALLGGTRSEVPGAWDAFDPVALVAASAPGVGAFPVDLLVGSDDRLVPASESSGLAAELDAAGVDVDVVELAGVDHFTIIGPTIADDIVAVLD